MSLNCLSSHQILSLTITLESKKLNAISNPEKKETPCCTRKQNSSWVILHHHRILTILFYNLALPVWTGQSRITLFSIQSSDRPRLYYRRGGPPCFKAKPQRGRAAPGRPGLRPAPAAPAAAARWTLPHGGTRSLTKPGDEQRRASLHYNKWNSTLSLRSF